MLCSLVLAAVIAPWAFQGGKWLAETAARSELPGVVEWLAESCGRARLGRFYDRSLLFSALVLLPFLSARIRHLRAVSAPAPARPAIAQGWRRAAAQIATGFVIASVLLSALGAILAFTGAWELKDSTPRIGKLFTKVLLPAAGATLVEEWLFRGLLLGLWLRFSRPATACLGSALLFAFLHFLKPPGGTEIADPSNVFAGFRLLGSVLLHFADPLFFVTEFTSLVVAGLILAWARVRTGRLWFPIGLHGGWIVSFKAYNLFYQCSPDHPLVPWGVGDSLRTGLLPLVTLGVTALVCGMVLPRFEDPERINRASR